MIFYAFFLPVISLITKSVPTVRRMPTGRLISAFTAKLEAKIEITPEIMNITKETAATVIA